MGDYSKLAALIGTHHDLALFRGFATLNVQNILYLQAELAHLEGELANIVLDNRSFPTQETASFQVSLFDLKASSGVGDDTQWQKVLEIRAKLKEYSKHLLVAMIRRYQRLPVLLSRQCYLTILQRSKSWEARESGSRFASRMARSSGRWRLFLAGTRS